MTDVVVVTETEIVEVEQTVPEVIDTTGEVEVVESAMQGPPGPPGPAGPVGPQGPQGPQGDPGDISTSTLDPLAYYLLSKA